MPLRRASGREATALADQRFIFGIGLGAVGLESRIRHFLISLLARSDRIGLRFPASLRDIDIVYASTIEAEHLLFERRGKLSRSARYELYYLPLGYEAGTRVRSVTAPPCGTHNWVERNAWEVYSQLVESQ
jgi:hypothetical protein